MVEIDKLPDEIDSLHPMEKKIMLALSELKEKNDDQLSQETGLDQSQLRRALGWLRTKEYIVVISDEKSLIVNLTDKGKQFAEIGTPEIKIISMLKDGNSVHIKDLRKLTDYEQDDISKAVGNLKKRKAIKIDKGFLTLDEQSAISTFVQEDAFLKNLTTKDIVNFSELTSEQQEFAQKGFRKRGKSKGTFTISELVKKTYRLSEEGQRLEEYMQEMNIPIEEISQLTPKHLKEGQWKGKSFRKYNITLPSPRIIVGRKHPYREFLDQLKMKLIGMGFEEMRGNIVENEFWNMDALFMPQFHAARDIHDMYVIKEPVKSKEIEEPFQTSVAQCHENGGNTGSKGWGYHFSKEKARQLILRSQGTVLSARTLASKPKVPGKYFAIARCFRYDHIDATHAPDFYQVEGIVLGEDINFRHLLGLLKLFAEEVALAKEVKYLPAYFPFTEPSVEVHIKHEQIGWMEMGGAGLFRPEVTIPLGVDVPVIAWGLGIDRMAMVALGIEDIRDLFSTDLDLIRSKVVKI